MHTCTTCAYCTPHPYLSPMWLCLRDEMRDEGGEYYVIDEFEDDYDPDCEYWQPVGDSDTLSEEA